MFKKNLKNCDEFIAGDLTILKELLNPLNEEVKTNYSLAYAKLEAGKTSLAHKLKSSEVYYIIEGEGIMYIDDEKEIIEGGDVIYIPPGSIQKVHNHGDSDLIFLCIVEPAWKPEDEEILE